MPNLKHILDLFFGWLFILSLVVVGFAVLITLILICVNVSFVAVGTISNFITNLLF
jgi:hypothetical protein